MPDIIDQLRRRIAELHAVNLCVYDLAMEECNRCGLKEIGEEDACEECRTKEIITHLKQIIGKAEKDNAKH